MILRFSLLIFGFMALANLGHAACSSPSGDEGEMVYNGTFKVMQFCNGTDWISMASSYARGIQQWNVRSSAATNFGTTTWADISGLSITFTLTETSDVKGHFTGGVYAGERGIHCGTTFVLDGVVQGDATYGDIISGGDTTAAGGTWWHSVGRARWWTLSPGTYTLKIQGRSDITPASASNCRFDGPDYSLPTLDVVAYPTS